MKRKLWSIGLATVIAGAALMSGMISHYGILADAEALSEGHIAMFLIVVGMGLMVTFA